MQKFHACLLALSSFFCPDTQTPPVINRVHLFDEVLGFSETLSQPLSRENVHIEYNNDGNTYVTSKRGRFANQALCCGNFTTYNIKTLQMLAVEQLKKTSLKTAGKGTFNFFMGKGYPKNQGDYKKYNFFAPKNTNGTIHRAVYYRAKIRSVSTGRQIFNGYY